MLCVSFVRPEYILGACSAAWIQISNVKHKKKKQKTRRRSHSPAACTQPHKRIYANLISNNCFLLLCFPFSYSCLQFPITYDRVSAHYQNDLIIHDKVMICIACEHSRLAKAPSSTAAIQLYRDDHVVIQVLIRQPAGKWSPFTWTHIIIALYRIIWSFVACGGFVKLCQLTRSISYIRQ